MFHHTALGLVDYVYVVKMAYHKAADPDDPRFKGIFLVIREHRGGHPVSERIIDYRNISSDECDIKIYEDALYAYNRAVLRDRVAFVCDSMMEDLICRFGTDERIGIDAMPLLTPVG
ncbi:hypothetical protein AURDEDRAFT_168431 [Auricularia subglabra TFB-10046 SS5]|nr:hypothetical protein AURDEDRAFT_168431 [Auricularia subglabra TFB-10046 SS5]